MPTEDTFPLALCAMQAEYKTIKKNKEVSIAMKGGGKFKFKYADLPQILDSMRPLMKKHGFSLLSYPDTDLNLVVELLHSSGVSRCGKFPLHQTANPKELGSEITYMRRYGAVCLLGLATEDDDDGEQAATGAGRRTAEPRKQKPKEKAQPAASYSSAALIKAIWTAISNTEKMVQIVDPEWSGEDWFRKHLKEKFDKTSSKELTTAEGKKVLETLKGIRDNLAPSEND